MKRQLYIFALSWIFALTQGYFNSFSSTPGSAITVTNFDNPITVSNLPTYLSSVSIIRVTVSILTGSSSGIELTLISPTGKQVGLYYQGRIAPTSFANLVFRDDGNEFAAGHNGANSGVLIPISRLNQFNGENPNGQWKLRTRGSGTLNSWSLFISDYCDFNPCLNGGRCDPNTLTCDCLVNFEGRLCENSFNIDGNEFVIGTQQHILLPDNGQSSSTITVPNIPFLGDVQVRAFITLPHTWLNDMVVTLNNPASTPVTLTNRVGGSQWNILINTEFNDNAPLAINQVALVSGTPQTFLKPMSGTMNSLGKVTTGTWTLLGQDQVGIDVGTFYKWSLHISGPNACPTEVFENARFRIIGGGQLINGTCGSSYYGFTSRGCELVNGIAQWSNSIDGGCSSCPPNSYAPLGSISISQCVCNNGYGKDINGNCVALYCPLETIGAYTYAKTQAGDTLTSSCGTNFIGSIQRVCTQDSTTAFWLNPNINCVCPSVGFTLVGSNCQDIDECQTDNGGCGAQTCFNNPGSRTCGCVSGYTLSGGNCVDINECATNNGGCGTGTCNNTPGSRTCSCPSGYTFNGQTCVDINECDTNNGNCGSGSCSNTVGSYSCQCFPGYILSASTCVDINECLTNNGDCGTIASCSNTPGSRTCTCPSGYEPFDGQGCNDINECLTNNGGCSANAKCTNTIGSRTCACLPGFTGNGLTCNDINECLTANGNCLQGTCVNTMGSRNCSCFTGYTNDDGGRCIDVNECRTNNGGCDPVATCYNYEGYRTCTCTSGYTGNGLTCTDINECLTNNGGCDSIATCVNTVGSKQCICPTGTVGNGYACSERKGIHYAKFSPLTRFSFDTGVQDEIRANTFANVVGSTQRLPIYQRNIPGNQAMRLDGDDNIIIPPVSLGVNFTFDVVFNTNSYPVSPGLSDILTVMPQGKTQRSDAMLAVSVDSNGRIVRSSNGVVLSTSNRIIRLGVTHSFMVSFTAGKLTSFLDGTNIGIINFNNHVAGTSYEIQTGLNFDGHIDEIGAFDIAMGVNYLYSIVLCKNACLSTQVCVNLLTGESCASKAF